MFLSEGSLDAMLSVAGDVVKDNPKTQLLCQKRHNVSWFTKI